MKRIVAILFFEADLICFLQRKTRSIDC